MKRSNIQILALIAAISAGGAVQASQGHVTGHHELPENTTAATGPALSKNGVQHLDRYSDGTLRSKPGQDDHQVTLSARNTVGDSKGVDGPLPPEAGAER